MPGDTQEQAADPALWMVFDKNAKRRDPEGNPIARMHEAAGRTWRLYADQGTRMPEQVARIFLRDPAFIVHDATGKQVMPLTPETQVREAPKRLPPDHVVAGVHELSTDALVTRAAQFPGGDVMTMETPHPNLVRFLVNAHKTMDNLNTAHDDEVDGRYLSPEERAAQAASRTTPDDMTPAELDRLLPKPNMAFA